MQTINNLSLLNTVRANPGTRAHFRIVSAQTNGTMAVIDADIIPGGEPPRHVHTKEDELIIIRNGEIEFFVGDDIIYAKAGDKVFMPKEVPHNFAVQTPEASVTIVVTPGGFENFFEAITLPYEGVNVPTVDRAPTAEEIGYFTATCERFGMYFV